MTKSKTIQQKMRELDELVAWFEGDDFALEQAIEKFQQAEALAETVRADLAALKNEVTVIKQKFDT